MPRLSLAGFASRIGVLLLSLFAAVASAAPPKDWTITFLGAINNDSSVAEQVNNRGDIVGWSSVFDPAVNANRVHAVLWQNGRMFDLGEGLAMSVNERGTIAGSVVGGLSLWKDGQWSRVGGGGMPGAPFSINKFEDIAGWHMGGAPHAYVYRDGTLIDIGTFGGTDSAAQAINDRGQVVGYAQVPGNANYHAFLWQDGVMTDLGTLGGNEARASDINDRGVIVGYSNDARGVPVGFIHDGVMRPLLADGACCALPTAINDRGDVVGTHAGTGSFLLEDGVFTRLEMIPAVREAGWVQLIPTDINDRGWIVGLGRTSAPVPPGHIPWKAFLLKRGR